VIGLTSPSHVGFWNVELSGSDVTALYNSGSGANCYSVQSSAVLYSTDTGSTAVQSAYRWRADDGSETTATWLAAENTSITRAKATNTRLRVQVDATGDLATTQYQLEYKLSSDSAYAPMLTATAAIPTWVSNGTDVSNTTGVTVTWPTHQVGDIGLLICESTGGQPVSLTTPSGFAAVTNSPSATGATTSGTQVTVFWCRATSTSMADVVITDPGDHVYAHITTFRGCIANGNPWNITGAAQKASATTSASAPSVTTTVPNCLIVNIITRDTDSAAAAFSAEANASLSSLAERRDVGTTSGNGGGVAVYTGGLATAGASGTTTATVSSSINASITIALRPEPPTFLMALSSNITASGVATTGQLTAPSGKTIVSDFVAGRMQDDENPADTIDITTDDYSEFEWCIAANAAAADGTYNFRVTKAGTALDTYTVTPAWVLDWAAIIYPGVVTESCTVLGNPFLTLS
jgi:hypothetical protein